jgi:hypothetical protein
MTLDPRFVIMSDLETYFVDNATGLPLANGIVTFYDDNSRVTLKDVYTLTGTPPNYTYTPIPNPNTLTLTGQISDSTGANVIPYYFPYEGTPSDSNGDVDLYYVTVYNSDGVLQFTRQGIPNISGPISNALDVTNYVENPQFVVFNYLPAPSGGVVGQIPAGQEDTVVAPGGWNFEVPADTTSVNIVTFTRFGSPIANPPGNPRYALNLQCTVSDSGDAYKYLTVRFPNVNSFSGQTLTFSFSIQSNTGGTQSANVVYNEFFGTGGSPTAEISTIVQAITIPVSYTTFNIPITFASTSGYIMGTNDDDYIEVGFSFPTNATFNIALTDVVLTPGNVTISTFPLPNNSFAPFVGSSLLPTETPYMGANLYLPIIMGPNGFQFDSSDIGKPFPSFNATLGPNELVANGQALLFSGYQESGIPNARVCQVYINEGANGVPLFGTGSAFITANISALSPASQLRISTNTATTSGITAAADGTAPTGFTFAEPAVGGNFSLTGYINGTENVRTYGTVIGSALNMPTAGTTSFTVLDGVSAPYVNTDQRDSPATYQIFDVEVVAASSITGSEYWTFATTTTNYYMWFTVNGTGTDPAPGGTGIKVALLSTYTATEVAQFVREAISGYQINTIICTAGNVVPASSYFTINTLTTHYYVWYKVSGAGTDPAPAGKTGILVNILTSDTAAMVASKTQIAINNFQVALPYLNGAILRGLDTTGAWDIDYASRWSLIPNYFGAQLGTYETDSILQHFHGLGGNASTAGSGNASLSSTTFPLMTSTNYSGTGETRPYNVAVNWVIKI